MGLQYWGHRKVCFFVTLSNIVTGRIKHYISAFGEHVIGKEVETAMEEACKSTAIQIKEFTVAPQIDPKVGLPFHEWFIEFEEIPEKIDQFAALLDQKMQKQNAYYEDLILGKVLRTLVITQVVPSAFQSFYEKYWKTGRSKQDSQIIK